MPEPMRIVAPEAVRVGTGGPDTLRFEEFFEAQAPGLFRRLYLITGDRGEAEEIMQDAFVAMFERWDRLRDLDDPEGYLYRIAFNLERRRRRRAAIALRRSLRLTPQRDDFAAVENRSLVAAALAKLTPRQRTALVLTELLGYPSDEAAAIMKVRPSTVRVLAHQGRAALRHQGEEPDD